MASKGSDKGSPMTLKTIVYALALIIVGIVVMWLSTNGYFDTHKTFKDLVNQLGGVLITTGAIAVLWDLFARRELMNEILTKTNLSSDIGRVGIKSVYMRPQDVPWGSLIKEAHTIDAYIAYGRSWYSNNAESIRQFVATGNTKLNVYLPNPADESMMAVLARRTNDDVDQLAQFIADTITSLNALPKGNKSEVKLYYRVGYPVYAAHRFDRKKAVVSLYRNAPAHANVPTLLIEEGSYLDFLHADLDETAIKSVPAT